MTVSPHDPRPPQRRRGRWRDVALAVAVNLAAAGLFELLKAAVAEGRLPLP